VDEKVEKMRRQLTRQMTGMCRHFTGSYPIGRCRAGVTYAGIVEPGHLIPLGLRLPCLNPGVDTCELQSTYTAEEIEDEVAVACGAFERTMQVLDMVKAAADGKRNYHGVLVCPGCKKELIWKVMGNGHVWAKCRTDKCVCIIQ
jgi:hypothetical protein